MIKNFKLPDFTLPAPLSRLGDRLPQLPPTLALVTGLNLALGRLIPREPLEMLAGKRFAIRVKDAGMTLRFGYNGRGFHPVFDSRRADLTISARARDFLALLAREEDPDTLFFNRRLVMEGDTDLGLLVKNTLDAVELPRFAPQRLSPAGLLARLRRITPHGT
ncbi:ubiquinone anaerobic biosynthesis accessory factor UbiT [Sulfuricystis multivorans]|uniref:ubiquinone anaerobic biosynthesis accessory factor UbiT n=1 Tax=Sulfuricystis multivorans TaxID=2211108 RepID=UPI000F82CFAC|nr:SCP2 sterol-binding domain-containing protein [Sulfuricystis multivorans]